jgi:hypothetical protein
MFLQLNPDGLINFWPAAVFNTQRRIKCCKPITLYHTNRTFGYTPYSTSRGCIDKNFLKKYSPKLKI